MLNERDLRPVSRVADRSGDAAVRGRRAFAQEDWPRRRRAAQASRSSPSRIEGRPIYLATHRQRAAARAAVVADARRRADAHGGAARSVELSHAVCRRAGRGGNSGRLHALCIPMLNPDGAEAGIRFNAQDIDINRDSRRLETPEGRALLPRGRNAEAGVWLQPAQSKCPHGRRHAAQAGGRRRDGAAARCRKRPRRRRFARRSKSRRVSSRRCDRSADGMIARYECRVHAVVVRRDECKRWAW